MVGGAEHALQMISEGMASRGHSVTVVTSRPEGALAEEERNGVVIRRIGSRQNRYAFTVAGFPTILREARRADLVHTATFNAAPPSWLAAKIARRPILLTVWETWIGHWSDYTTLSGPSAFAHEILERAIFALPYDRYIAISRFTRDRLLAVLPHHSKKVDFIYPGFDPRPWEAQVNRSAVRDEIGATDNFLVVGYGRPGISKGFEYLVDAAPLIAARVPSALILLILNDAPQYASLLSLLKARAASNIRFMPSQPLSILQKIVASADCVVIPSLAEGFGYTTLESVTTGVPVVASRIASIPEVIGGRHLFADPKSAASIADRVVDVAHGRTAATDRKSFLWSATIDAYESEYRRCLSA